MGRGRAKAKQTKVARELKYNSGGFDPDALRAELLGADGQALPSTKPANSDADTDADADERDDEDDDQN